MANINNTRSKLMLGTASLMIAALGAGVAHANSLTLEGQSTLGEIQNNNTGVTIGSTVTSSAPTGNASGNISNSTVTLGTSATDRNVQSATGIGNDATMTITASLNNETGVTMPVATADSGGLVAEIGIAIAQINTGVIGNVLTNSGLSLNVGAISDSTVKADFNMQEAISLLNRATNVVSSTANSSDATSGISNYQKNDESDLTVTTSTAVNLVANSATGTGQAVSDSTLSVANNTQRAIGIGNTAANSQTLSITDVTLENNAGGAEVDGTATATGGFVTASNQLAVGDTTNGNEMTASVDASGAGFAISISGDTASTGGVANATVRADANSGIASLRANDVSNSISLTGNSLDTSDGTVTLPGTVMAVASLQSVSDYSLTAEAYGVAGSFAEIGVQGSVGTSTLSASGNMAMADVTGNRGLNTLAANVASIATNGNPEINGTATVTSAGVTTATAAFGVANSQSIDADTSITASLVDDPTAPTSGARVATSIGTDVIDSTVRSNGNVLTGTAAGNIATANSVTLTGNSVATTTAVANSQSMNGGIQAVIGSPDADGQPPADFTRTATLLAGAIHDSGTNTITSGQFEISGAGLLSGQIAALLADGWTLSGGNYVKSAAGYSATSAAYTALQTTGTPETYTSILVPYSPASGGVTIAVGDDIDGSTLSVDGNSVSGAVDGNTAVNRIAVTSATIAPGGDLGNATADPTGVEAVADNALVNAQVLGGDIASEVQGDFGVFTQNGTASSVDQSTLSVSGNAMSSTASGNTVANGITLGGNDVQTTAALISSQRNDGGDVDVFASSDSTIYAPAANSGSTLRMNANSSTATTLVNDAANSVTLNASTVTTSGTADEASLTSDTTNPNTSGDYVLNNTQVGSGGSSEARAYTTVSNWDSLATQQAVTAIDPDAFDTDGAQNSTIEANGNTTVAEASTNSASNRMSLTGTASLQASGGVLNNQSNGTAVTSYADAGINLDIAGNAADEALDSSSLSISSNATTARSTGNTATNVLNAASATLSGTGADDAALGTGTATTATATYALQNQQQNTQRVEADARGDFSADFEAGTGLGASNATIALNGNTVNAEALANTATNAMALNGATGMAASGGVLNAQSNAAAVYAIASSSVSVDGSGVGGTGAIGSSSVTLAGNSTSARAGANTVVNTVTASSLEASGTGATATDASINSTGTSSAGATYAVLNQQANSSGVEARTYAGYETSFTADAGDAAQNGTRVALNGNVASSLAYANSATNSLTLTALNAGTSGVSATVINNQTNTASVTAYTSGYAATAATGAVSGASIALGGGSVTAMAVGNSVTSTLVRN